jgi:hypothetical protein
MDQRLMSIGARLSAATAGCRPDMHEPDEQGLQARVVGFKLDNAQGDRITEHGLEAGYQELVIVLDRLYPQGGQKVERFNLADLLALARYGSEFLQVLEAKDGASRG